MKYPRNVKKLISKKSIKKAKNVLIKLHGQKPLILLTTVLLSVTLVLGSTFAWFTTSDEVRNVFESQELSFSYRVREVFTRRNVTEFNETVQKEVWVENTGKLIGVVRLLVLPVIVAENGMLLEAIPGVTFTYNNLNTTAWADGGDGYFYFLSTLDEGEITPNLFNSVTLMPHLPEIYQNASMIIEIKAEAAEPGRYRSSWWGLPDNQAPPSGSPLLPIDTALQQAI